MSNKRECLNTIWTDHALERLSQRKLPQYIAMRAFTQPDIKVDGKQPGSVEFQKQYEKSLITLIGTKNNDGKWIIISAWIDPPLQGSIDIEKNRRYKEYKKANWWQKIILSIRDQFGL